MSDPKSDESNMEMESSVSIAVVKPDHGAIIERMEDGVNLAAGALSAAGIAGQAQRNRVARRECHRAHRDR